MSEKYGLYKELDDKITETFEQIKKDKRESSYNYDKDYNEAKDQIEAFYIYKKFIEEYLPKVIREAINEHLYIDEDLSKKSAMSSLAFLNFYVLNEKVEGKIQKDHFVVDKNVFYYFIDYLKKFIKRAKMKYDREPGYLSRGYSKSPYNFDVYTSIKELIDCYYNELQAIEMIEEEINLLKEDYHLTDVKLSLDKK